MQGHVTCQAVRQAVPEIQMLRFSMEVLVSNAHALAFGNALRRPSSNFHRGFRQNGACSAEFPLIREFHAALHAPHEMRAYLHLCASASILFHMHCTADLLALNSKAYIDCCAVQASSSVVRANEVHVCCQTVVSTIPVNATQTVDVEVLILCECALSPWRARRGSLAQRGA